MYILKKYENKPDYENIVAAARNQKPKRLPLYEHGINPGVIYAITGKKPYSAWYSKDTKERDQAFVDWCNFWKIMGYDTISTEFSFNAALVGHGALGAGKDGCIKTREDFNKYPWDEIPERYFSIMTDSIESFGRAIPPGMKGLGGVANGIFEAVQDIVGYMDLCYIKGDDPELFIDIFKAMGDAQVKVWREFLRRYESYFCVLRFGDDLGFKTMSLLSTEDILENIIPTYKTIVEMVHSYNKPFLLHSCGHIFNVMDALINDVKIDAKHSNEDQIAPFTDWVKKYGEKIGNFGGIDMDVLASSGSDDVKKAVLEILEEIKDEPGIAFSTGNSIPDYIPVDNYIAMIETVRDWRGDTLL